MEKKTPTTVKNEVRTNVFQSLKEVMAEKYGVDNVFIIGDTEIAVNVATSPDGEPIFATFSPTIKDYCDRKTPKKVIPKFDIGAAVNAFQETLDKRKENAALALEKKAKKIERDKAAREKARIAREKRKEG